MSKQKTKHENEGNEISLPLGLLQCVGWGSLNLKMKKKMKYYTLCNPKKYFLHEMKSQGEGNIFLTFSSISS
jgi:hypothetical protein